MKQLSIAVFFAALAACSLPTNAAAQSNGTDGETNCKACKYLGWLGYACQLNLAVGYNYCQVYPNYPDVCYYGPEPCGQSGVAFDGSATVTDVKQLRRVSNSEGVTAVVTCTGAIVRREYRSDIAQEVRQAVESIAL